MNYLLQRFSDHWDILNADTDCTAGSVYPLDRPGLYSLCRGHHDEIALIASIDEAIPTLAAYYDRNPPRWGRERAIWRNWYGPDATYTKYTKWTQFGKLHVEREEPKRWLPYRDDYPLMRGSDLRVFATSHQARRAADAHMCDGYPNSVPNSDGFSFDLDPELQWWTCEDRVVERLLSAA